MLSGSSVLPDSDSLCSTQLKTARGEIARVDAKVDSVEKSVRAELAEVDQRHTSNFKEASSRIHILELAKEEVREELDAMKPRISVLEEDSAATKETLANHGERYTSKVQPIVELTLAMKYNTLLFWACDD